jgi:hypothetical protein
MTISLSKQVLYLALLALFAIPSPVLASGKAQAQLAAAASAGEARPALLLTGSLDRTAAAAPLCMPFSIRYSVKNAGNIPVSAGSFRLEIKAASTGQSVFARQQPYAEDAGSIELDKMELPEGTYTVTLKASVMNLEYGLTREFLLDEQPLAVVAPLTATRGSGPFPRVLFWAGKSGSAVEQAVAGQIVKQAFDNEGIYYRTANGAEDFTNQALSGFFNTYVLFETDERAGQFDWLQDRVARGSSLVIIGSGERSRAVAESFGFRFSGEAPGSGSAMLTFIEGSGMGVTGTLQISGRCLVPQKQGATPAALFSGDRKPAVLIDKTGKGRVTVLPFSFIQSVLRSGATPPYSLLLRAAVQSAAIGEDGQDELRGEELILAASAGPVKARVVVTLPQGATALWTSAGGTAGGNTVFFDVTADREPQKFQHLYRLPEGGKGRPAVELFYECAGKMVRQGKLE